MLAIVGRDRPMVAGISGRDARGDVRARPASRSRAKSAPPADGPRITVALDGPASSGKSSVGASAAGRLGLRFVDTGLIYRAMTAIALREGVPLDDAPRLVDLVGRVTLGDDGTGRLTRVLLDGEDTTDDVRPRPSTSRCRPSRACPRSAPRCSRASVRSRPAAGSWSRVATSARSCCRTRSQGVPRRVGRRARDPPDRRARPGSGRRGGRARPRAAAGPRLPRSQPGRGAPAGGRRRRGHRDRRQHVRADGGPRRGRDPERRACDRARGGGDGRETRLTTQGSSCQPDGHGARTARRAGAGRGDTRQGRPATGQSRPPADRPAEPEAPRRPEPRRAQRLDNDQTISSGWSRWAPASSPGCRQCRLEGMEHVPRTGRSSSR